ncbi:hypothetical protein Ddye_020133 [Dipteronia dyeriana]|uniref:Uncharacterized protein n=1 Tax=Dipteronia dyeriana TaxID=168575 RepID=A0AAD9TZM5_9ROSI|nr:hypothetical protein Ddye_020133 [Dipteronia dyeriana]
MLNFGELKTDMGANQVCTLTRPGATRWSSHYSSFDRLIDMFGATCTVLENTKNNGINNNIRGEAKWALQVMGNFEFVFILQLMNEVLGITHMLCQALQSKSQDILNAMHLIRSTKILHQYLRQDGCDKFLYIVLSFSEDHEINMSDMSARYREGTSRSYQQQNNTTVEHYYHFNIFNVVIDFQLMGLDTRFPYQKMELLTLSSALDPTNHFESFNIDDKCTLAKKFYPDDFIDIELSDLKGQL